MRGGARESLRGWPAFALFSGAAVVAGYGVAKEPTVILAVIAVPVFLRYPMVALLVGVGLEGTRQLLLDQGVPNTAINVAQVGGIVVASVGAAWRVRTRLPTGYWIGLGMVLAVAIPGILFPQIPHPFATSAISISFLVTPVLASLIGYAATVGEIRAVAWTAALVVVANVIVAFQQQVLGVEGLVAQGYRYGETVRQIGDNLRSFGLTTSNASLGTLMAGAGILIVAPRLVSRPLPWRLDLAVIGLSAYGIFLSTSRSGLIMMGVFFAITAGALSGRPRASRIVGVLVTAVGGIALVRAFLRAGAAQSDSLFERFDVWETLVREHGSVAGLGPGTVGAASYSVQGTGQGIFVDNSWLSIYLQFGALGLFVAVVGALWALRASLGIVAEDRTAPHGRVLLAAGSAVAITAIFIELVDYSAAMWCVGVLVGVAAREAVEAHGEGAMDDNDARGETSCHGSPVGGAR